MTALRGCRVLVVEDEAFIAMTIEDILEALGCVVVGPAARVQQALELASREPLDAALLDVNVAGEFVFPVPKLLVERRVPFAFVTGYGRSGLDGRYPDAPVLQKPFRAIDLETVLNDLLNLKL